MAYRTMRRRAWVLAGAVALAGCVASHPGPASAGGDDAASRFAREWARVPSDPTELRIQLSASPFAFFRFVNRAWTREVCDAFASDAAGVPSARLHGDAHVEQYAVTADARGLDDFDDSASGPAVVDLVRFLGSLELAAAQRGWTDALPTIVDAFVDGYRRALDDPSYLPPDPAVVTRARAAPVRSTSEFHAWVRTLMEPLSAEDLARVDWAWPKVERLAAQITPEFAPTFLRRKAVGWLHMGIGSRLTPKLLIHIEGPSAAADDDLILEAKKVGPFEGESCVTIPRASEAHSVVEGIRQIGRLPQRLLVALPGVGSRGTDSGDWWLKAWDRTHVELTVAHLETRGELRDVAHDVGAQLGSTNLAHAPGGPSRDTRRAELEALARLEPRIRRVAHELTVALVEAWERGRTPGP